MPDDNTQVDDSQVDGGQVDDSQTDGDEVDITKQSDSDFMADTVDFIKQRQAAELGEDDSDEDDGGTESDGDSFSGNIEELAGTDIPDAFSEAAEASGMTPEELIAFADKHTNEELIAMIPALQASLETADDGKGDDKVTKQDDDKDNDVDNKDIDPEMVKSITEKISKQLEEKFGATLKEIDDFKAYQQEQSNKQTVDTASKILDEAAKEFPVFGKTDELPRFPSGRLAGQLIPTSPAMKARLEVLKYADAFIASGADIDNAMANALATYKGLHLEKELERKQVRDLKNHEKKLSGAHTGHETKKKYADTRSEIIDDIRQMQRAAGIE
jgi:hypothetical protein